MIVPTGELGGLAGTVTMVSGGFDPLHPGHLAYFRAAAALGAPLLVNVSHDEWVGRKHVPLLTQVERIQVIDALEMVDYVHAEQGPTFEVLRALRPRYFAKGADWGGAAPAGGARRLPGRGHGDRLPGHGRRLVDRRAAPLQGTRRLRDRPEACP